MMPTTTPATADQIAHCLALLDDSWAPATSPAAHFELTCAAKTIEAMPSGRQQKIVDRIAHTR